MSKYMDALKSLYGETIELPATTPLDISRSRCYDEKRKPRKNIEGGLQMRLVAWALGEGLPIFSIPNEGNRGRIATAQLKQMGLRPGAADLFLARRSCCGSWPGYFIELKSPGERPRANQMAFMTEMQKEGFRADWFDDWLLARQSIIDYLGLKK
jgi:hypothetical protein